MGLGRGALLWLAGCTSANYNFARSFLALKSMAEAARPLRPNAPRFAIKPTKI
jgi:hypothetical protein